MARKGRTMAMIVQFRRDSVIPSWRYETIFACREALRKQTAATVSPTGTNGVRSCWYQYSTSFTANFSSVPFPAWQHREEGYDRGRDGIPPLRQHRRIPG